MDVPTLPREVEAGVPVLLLRPEQAAAALNIGRTNVYALIRTGRLRSVKVGGLRRIPVDALAELVRQLEQEAA